MTLTKWGHYPKFRGYHPFSQGSWRLQEGRCSIVPFGFREPITKHIFSSFGSCIPSTDPHLRQPSENIPQTLLANPLGPSERVAGSAGRGGGTARLRGRVAAAAGGGRGPGSRTWTPNQWDPILG